MFIETLSLAADYLPLAAGNRWVYRASNGQHLTISVGAPLALIDGRSFYRVTGYAPKPEWVRRLADGALVAYNEETGEEHPLIAFDRASGWRRSGLAACEQEAQPLERPVAHRGPAGRFEAALEMRYRSYNCADAGLESERYLDNVGLLQRVASSFAGPVVYDLVYARVGNLVITSGHGAGARVELPAAVLFRPAPSAPVTLRATLRVSVDSEPLELTFASSQRTDFAIYNEQGSEVFRWSDRMAFAPALGKELLLGERAFPLEGELAGLPDGRYRIGAWLATPQPSFAAAAAFELRSEPPGN